jgi:hypothetical protein
LQEILQFQLKKRDPGNVICDITVSKYSEVSFPGRIPGTKPPLRFRSSDILFVGTVIAV